MKNAFCYLSILSLGITVLTSISCGPKNELGRKAVSGQISVDGQALTRGSILFAPDDRRGVSSGAEIDNGTYTVPEHQGLLPGSYTVRVYAADESAEAVAPELPGPGIKTQPELIPAEYNMRSKLKLVVEESQAATFDLDIKSK